MNRALMLPYVALAAWLGCTYLTADPQRIASPAFRAAMSLAPLDAWGVLFLIGAVAMTLAALAGSRAAIAVTLFIGGCLFVWWGVLFGISVITDQRANPNGPAYCGFVATMHYLGAWRAWVSRA